MPYCCTYDVPAPVAMYREVKRRLGEEAPDGLLVHLVVQVDGGLRHIEVWTTETAWTRYHDERVEPIVHDLLRDAGFTEMPPDPPMTSFDVVDLQVGA